MSNLNQNKDAEKVKPPIDKNAKDGEEVEKKPSRLAERKGQRPAFPFKRKPV